MQNISSSAIQINNTDQNTSMIDQSVNSTVLSEENIGSMYLLQMIAYCVMYPIMCFIGIFGNVLTIVVVREQKRTSPSFLILALAVADIISLISISIFTFYRICNFYFPDLALSMLTAVPSLFIIDSVKMCKRLSKCILVPIVIERTLAVWFPLKVKNIWSIKASIVAVIAVTLFCLGLNTPNLIDIILVHKQTINQGGIVYSGENVILLELQRYFRHISYSMEYLKKMNILLLDLFPMTFVIVTNVILIVGIRLHFNDIEETNTKSTLSSNRRQQTRQITFMLLSVAVVFVVLCLPLDIGVILVDYFEVRNMHPAIFIILDLLATLNHAINFVLYGVCNSKYKTRFIYHVTCQRFRKRHTEITAATSNRPTNKKKEFLAKNSQYIVTGSING